MNAAGFAIGVVPLLVTTLFAAIQPEQVRLEDRLSRSFYKTRAGKAFIQTGNCPALIADGKVLESLGFRMVHLCDRGAVSVFYNHLTIDLKTGKVYYGVDENLTLVSSIAEESDIARMIHKLKLPERSIRAKVKTFCARKCADLSPQVSRIQTSKMMRRIELRDANRNNNNTVVVAIHLITGQVFLDDMFTEVDDVMISHPTERVYKPMAQSIRNEP